MINHKSIDCYKGIHLSRGRDFLYIPPNILLQPYISCYTITFPIDMPGDYTILPTASTTIVISVSDNNIFCSLRGVNTKTCNVGARANKMKFLLLIEFRTGCLYPFMKVDQNELTDHSFDLNELDNSLAQTIVHELIKSESVDALVEVLDKIFLARLTDYYSVRSVSAIMNRINKQNGNISTKELTTEFYYSDKHIRRLFLQHVGTSPKMYSRIVRVNHALRLLQNNPTNLIEVASDVGFFDQPHFIHDFKTICGITPKEYIQNMSVFYNDEFKM
jgi:AraC-like DNA-binding protein